MPTGGLPPGMQPGNLDAAAMAGVPLAELHAAALAAHAATGADDDEGGYLL